MSMKWWKALGVAAFVGVAATGVAVARAERERRAYTPEQVRERLHARVAEVGRAENGRLDEGAVSETSDAARARGPVRRVRAGLEAVRSGSVVATIGRWVRKARGAGDRRR